MINNYQRKKKEFIKWRWEININIIAFIGLTGWLDSYMKTSYSGVLRKCLFLLLPTLFISALVNFDCIIPFIKKISFSAHIPTYTQNQRIQNCIPIGKTDGQTFEQIWFDYLRNYTSICVCCRVSVGYTYTHI